MRAFGFGVTRSLMRGLRSLSTGMSKAGTPNRVSFVPGDVSVTKTQSKLKAAHDAAHDASHDAAHAAEEAAAAAAGTLPASCGPENEEEDEMEEMFVQGPAGMEWGGPTRGGQRPEPTRFKDWERKGRCTDF